MVINPMLANTVSIDDVERKCAGYIMEPKLDGVRCIVDISRGPVEIYTRTGKDLKLKVPHLWKAFNDFDVPIILDGELIWFAEPELGRGADFNQTMRIVGSSPNEAVRKQEEVGWLSFVVFDILGFGRMSYLNEPFIMRKARLAGQTGLNSEDMFHSNPYIGLLLNGQMTYKGVDLDVYDIWVKAGYEGAMFKNPKGLYKPSKRPANNWYKLKKYLEVDAVIIGYKGGQGKYEGQIGAIQFRTEDGTEGWCSGMDDAVRLKISNCWPYHLNKHIEVKHYGKVGVEGNGYRHPQFRRFRPDKD